MSDDKFSFAFKKGLVESVEHYKMIIKERKKCETCGKVSVVREKVIME